MGISCMLLAGDRRQYFSPHQKTDRNRMRLCSLFWRETHFQLLYVIWTGERREANKGKFGHPKIQGLVKKSPYSLSNSHPVPSETSYGLKISKHTTQIHSWLMEIRHNTPRQRWRIQSSLKDSSACKVSICLECILFTVFSKNCYKTLWITHATKSESLRS